MKGHAGIFERYAAMVADALALKVEWQVPEGGVGSVYSRDYDMVRAADRVLAFFAPDAVMQGGTGHVVEAAMASEVPAEAWVLADDGKLEWVGSYAQST
jgi:hypothetical protein